MDTTRTACGLAGFCNGNRIRRTRAWIAAATVFAGLGICAGANAAVYAFTNLGTIGTDTDSSGFGLNSNSTVEVVGVSGIQAAYSLGGGNLQSFNHGSGTPSTAYAVNDSGVAVGSYTNASSGASLAFYANYSPVNPVFVGMPTTLTGGGSVAGSNAAAVNGNGAAFEAVGQYQIAGSNSLGSAFYWKNSNSGLTPLDPSSQVNGLGGNTSQGAASTATGLNASGDIVGYANTAAQQQHAFIYNPANSKMYDLGTQAAAGGNSAANAVNTSGVIVGSTDTDAGYNRAFSYTGYNFSTTSGTSSDTTLEGTFTDLGSLDGTTSGALAINSSGVVVGYSSFDAGNAQHAFVYVPGTGPGQGVMQDLNDLVTLPNGYELDAAAGINAAGDITGYGDNGTDQFAFLLVPTAVPEPASAVMLACGGLVLLGRRRRTIR